MSHPPETSLTSPELARSVYAAIYDYLHSDPLSVEERADIEVDESGAAALIDAWVRVREGEARLDELVWASGAELKPLDNAIIQKRIVELSAEIENLKSQEVNTKGESA